VSIATARDRRTGLAPFALAIMLAAGAAQAEDLRGADRFLCSSLEATVCFADSACLVLPPEELNIPQFIIVDAKTGKLETTAASAQRRETKADSVRRADETIQLQGHEAGRAFSLLINELTGRATFTSAADERGVIVFAACTPVPRS
jgi:hypothetical protein